MLSMAKTVGSLAGLVPPVGGATENVSGEASFFSEVHVHSDAVISRGARGATSCKETSSNLRMRRSQVLGPSPPHAQPSLQRRHARAAPRPILRRKAAFRARASRPRTGLHTPSALRPPRPNRLPNPRLRHHPQPRQEGLLEHTSPRGHQRQAIATRHNLREVDLRHGPVALCREGLDVE